MNNYKLTNDLLEILIKFPDTGLPDEYNKMFVKKLAEHWAPSQFVFLSLRPFTGSHQGELAYSVYSSADHSEYSFDPSYPSKTSHQSEIVLVKSEILSKLAEGRNSEFHLDKGDDLSRVLQEKNVAIEGEILGVPIKRENGPIAFFLFNASSKKLLNTKSFEVIKKIIYLAFDKRNQLYKEKDRIHNALSEIAVHLGKFFEDQSSEGDVLQCVLDYTQGLLKAKKCALFLVDSSEKSLVLEKASGEIDFKKIKDVATYAIEHYNPDEKKTGVTPWVLHRKKPFNARDFSELVNNSEGHWKGNWDNPMYGDPVKASKNFQCVYMAPLLAGDKAIGVLKYENRTDDANKIYFDQQDERLIDIIAELVTNLVISQRIERNRYDSILPMISSTLISYFGQPCFFEKLLDKCREILSADLCSLFLLDNQNNLVLKAIVGVSDDVKDKLKNFAYENYQTAVGLTPWILTREKHGKPFNVRNYPDLKARSEGHHCGNWDHIVYHNRPEEEFKSLYSIPLTIPLEGDEVKQIGVFKIENKNIAPYYFTESDERLFDLIGRLIAIGVIYENEQYLGLMLRAAELGFLASGVSHEFNNYLQRFLIMAENAKETCNNETAKEKITQLMGEIGKASEVIDNFRRIKNRLQRVEAFDLDSLINEIIDLSRKRFISYNIKIKYKNKANIKEVILNPSELQTIILNLLNNAFESIIESKKQGNIEVFIKQGVPGNFCIEVADSGKGFSQDQKKHIFMPFFTTKAPKGMGMGLFWVQRIVKNMGGEITLESPNCYQGATFLITLPREIKSKE